MAETVKRTLGVTIAFSLGAALIVGALYILDAVGFGGELTRGVDSWAAQAVETVGFATLAGLIVDLLRFLAAIVWPKYPKYGFTVRKAIRENLV